MKKYYVIVLPMATDGSVNRQIYEFEDYESAKQSYHANCGKYFKSSTLKQCSVCILDDLCATLVSDFWKAPEVETVTE